jgi:hypothetical protein
MTADDQPTHGALADELRATLRRLRSDIEARSDPVLEDVTSAIELLLDIASHAHQHALENRGRIERLEAQG